MLFDRRTIQFLDLGKVLVLYFTNLKMSPESKDTPKPTKEPRSSYVVHPHSYNPEKDIMYIPYDESTDKGGYYKCRDGSSVPREALAALAMLGAIGD